MECHYNRIVLFISIWAEGNLEPDPCDPIGRRRKSDAKIGGSVPYGAVVRGPGICGMGPGQGRTVRESSTAAARGEPSSAAARGARADVLLRAHRSFRTERR